MASRHALLLLVPNRRRSPIPVGTGSPPMIPSCRRLKTQAGNLRCVPMLGIGTTRVRRGYRLSIVYRFTLLKIVLTAGRRVRRDERMIEVELRDTHIVNVTHVHVSGPAGNATSDDAPPGLVGGACHMFTLGSYLLRVRRVAAESARRRRSRWSTRSPSPSGHAARVGRVALRSEQVAPSVCA